jgi:hypothetical protein
MTNDNKLENESANAKEQPSERRAYEAPAVKDFFQPLVVLGTAGFQPGICASSKAPKR